jgi:hypothetical protein
MHPEIMRQLHTEHSRDLRERAHRAGLARTARRALRALRRTRPAGADEFAVPAIPDYVDGSFRTAADAAASAAQGHVPAARRAA